MKKKVISVLMASAMSLSLLAGCGDTAPAATESNDSTATETPAADSNSDSDSAEAPAASGDVTEISVYRCTFNLANPDSAQVQKVQDAINAYIADKIPVKIKLTDIGSGEYTDKANLALANNEINLLWTASWEGTIGTNDLYPANAVYDLTDLVPGTPLYSSMAEGQWEAAKYDGKIYFVPVYKDNVEGYDFMFRQDLVDKHNWDINSVKELKDLEPMLADAKADGLKYPFLTQKTAMFYRWYIDKFDFFTADSATNFFAVDRAKDEVVDTIQTPEYLEFCKLIRDDKQMRKRLLYLSGSEHLGILIDVIDIMLKEDPLSSRKFCLNRCQCPHALAAVKVRDSSEQVRKIGKEIGHTTTLVIDKQETYFVGTEIKSQRQDIRLNKLGLTRTGSTCNKTVRTMSLLVKVQAYDIILASDTERYG